MQNQIVAGKPESKAAAKRREQTEAVDCLRRRIRQGDKVYGKVVRVSSSGMSRDISFYIVENGKIEDVTWWMGRALDIRPASRGWEFGIHVSGCGTDMVFETIYNLARTLFKDGFTCTGENCKSNDHTNGDRNRKKHRHSDPGYALAYGHI